MAYSIEEHFLLTKQIFDLNRESIILSVEKSKFQHTAKALYSFCEKIDSLTEALVLLCEAKNFYTSNIVLRCLFEHLFIAHYIWVKCVSSKDDNCGKEYYIDYTVSEFIRRERFNLKVIGIKNQFINHNTLENLKEKYDFLKEATQTDIDTIHRTGNQFDISQIGNFLNKMPYENTLINSFSLMHKNMLDFIHQYNELSTFVHGGPIAEKLAFETLTVDEKEKQLKEIRGWGLIASRMAKFNLLSLLADENASYFKLLDPIMNYYKHHEQK